MIIALLKTYGLIGVFVLSILEAIFLPIPVETLLIPFIILNTNLLIPAVILCTLGSVIGAVIGHYIGRCGDRIILSKFIKRDSLKNIKGYFYRYGIWAVGLAALTPLPYKIFSITSGILGIKIRKLIKVALICRGLRFIAVALSTSLYGDFFIKIFL